MVSLNSRPESNKQEEEEESGRAWLIHARPFVGAFQCRSWNHRVVLGAIFGYLSPKYDKVSEKLTLRYPHEGPCVEVDHVALRPWSFVVKARGLK